MNPEVAKIIKRDDVLQLIDDGNISAVLSKIEKECPYYNREEIYKLFISCGMISQEMIGYLVRENVQEPESLKQFDVEDKNGKVTLVWRFYSVYGEELNPEIVEFTNELRTYVEKTFPEYKISKLIHNKKSFYVYAGRSNYYEDVRLVLTVPVMKETVDPKLYIKQLVTQLKFDTKCLQSTGAEIEWNGDTAWANTVKRGTNYCLRIYEGGMSDKSYIEIETAIRDFINKNKLKNSYVKTGEPIFRIYAYIESYQ